MRVGNVRNYPVLQELVTVLSLVAIVVVAVENWSMLPAQMAGKIGVNGARAAWLSPIAQFSIIMAVFISLWIGDAALRYFWLLQENGRRRFNWIQFLMTPSLPLVAWGWFILVKNNTVHLGSSEFYLQELGFALGACTIFMIVTELKRSAGERVSPTEQSAVTTSLSQAAQVDRLPAQFVVIEWDRPMWLMIATVVSVMVMGGGAAAMLAGAGSMPDPVSSLVLKLSALLLLLAIVVVVAFGAGFRFVFHAGGIDIRLGFCGVKLKGIRAQDITAAEVRSYSPLADFGGWGVRFAANNTTAFVLSGQRGLEVRTKTRNFVLSVKNPDLLAHLINVRLISAQ